MLSNNVTSGTAGAVVLKSVQAGGTVLFSGNITNANTGGAVVRNVTVGDTSTGLGTVTFSGTNTFTGSTVVNAGTLDLNTTGGSALGGTTNVTVSGSAILLVSKSNQVNNAASVTLSGGTIQRATGVSETFGSLDLTAASTLNFGSGTAGNLTFGTYEGGGTPDFKLTVNNFFAGNTLVFGSDLSSFISASYSGTAFTSTWFNINSTSGGFVSDWNVTTANAFTITAVPEPSTVAAAIGLVGLLGWPVVRRRLARGSRTGA